MESDVNADEDRTQPPAHQTPSQGARPVSSPAVRSGTTPRHTMSSLTTVFAVGPLLAPIIGGALLVRYPTRRS